MKSFLLAAATLAACAALSGMEIQTEYDEGTLILDIVDAESRTLIWRGSARAEVSATVAPETREARVREAVRRILEQFPPK